MLAIRLPDTIEERLNTLAAETGRTKTALAREAIVDAHEMRVSSTGLAVGFPSSESACDGHRPPAGVWPDFFGSLLVWWVAGACQLELNRVAARSGVGFWSLVTGGDLLTKWKKAPGRSVPAQSS